MHGGRQLKGDEERDKEKQQDNGDENEAEEHEKK